VWQEGDEAGYVGLGGRRGVYPIRTVRSLLTDVCGGIKGTCLSASVIITIRRYLAQQFFLHLLELMFTHTYMIRHCRVILREIVINTLPSYTSISYTAVGNTVYN